MYMSNFLKGVTTSCSLSYSREKDNFLRCRTLNALLPPDEVVAAPFLDLLKIFGVLDVLGKGAFAQCHLVKRKSDGVLFALKKYVEKICNYVEST